MGTLVVARGEIWWGETPSEKGRPYLVVSRDGANAVMQHVLVAPITRTIRRVPSELAVGPDEGLPTASVASFDNTRPFPKSMLVRRLGQLADHRRHLLCAVIAATFDC